MTSATVDVKVEIECGKTAFGDTLAVVGYWTSWWMSRLELDGSGFPIWRGSLRLEPGEEIEYKYVIIRTNGEFSWEPVTGNRVRRVGASGVSQCWQDGQFGKIENDVAPVQNQGYPTAGGKAPAAPVLVPIKETVQLRLMVQCAEAAPGECVAVAGSWDWSASPRKMDGSSWPKWSGVIPVAPQERIEYKYVILENEGKKRWESIDGNRVLNAQEVGKGVQDDGKLQFGGKLVWVADEAEEPSEEAKVEEKPAKEKAPEEPKAEEAPAEEPKTNKKPRQPSDPNKTHTVLVTDVMLAYELEDQDQEETITRVMNIDKQLFPPDNQMKEAKVQKAIVDRRMMVAMLNIPKGGVTKPRAVGFLIWLQKSDTHWTLDKIATHPNYGGRKIGTALMEKWAKVIPVSTFPDIMVDLHVRGHNDVAAGLYVKAGWEDKGVVGRFRTGGREEKLKYEWPKKKILETREKADDRVAEAEQEL